MDRGANSPWEQSDGRLMKSQTLIIMTSIGRCEISALVKAELADSLYAFLQREYVDCMPPGGEQIQFIRYSKSDTAPFEVEPEILVREIIASTSLSEFATFVGKWLADS